MGNCTIKSVQDLNHRLQPAEGEEVYCEHDDDLDQYCVFGCDSGFCYAAGPDENEMQARARAMNG